MVFLRLDSDNSHVCLASWNDWTFSNMPVPKCNMQQCGAVDAIIDRIIPQHLPYSSVSAWQVPLCQQCFDLQNIRSIKREGTNASVPCPSKGTYNLRVCCSTSPCGLPFKGLLHSQLYVLVLRQRSAPTLIWRSRIKSSLQMGFLGTLSWRMGPIQVLSSRATRCVILSLEYTQVEHNHDSVGW